MVAAGLSDGTRRATLVDWVLACTAGELLGLGTAAGVAGVLLVTVGEPVNPGARILVLTLMVAAGALEGFWLGLFQWRVLRRCLPVAAGAWIGVTVAVAALGWLLGMLPSTFQPAQPANSDPMPELSDVAIVGLSVAFGLAVGTVFGAAQWLVLRSVTPHAGVWIPANAVGWAAALPWIYLAASRVPDGASPFTIMLSGAAGGTLTGLILGLVTGLVLLRLEAHPIPS